MGIQSENLDNQQKVEDEPEGITRRQAVIGAGIVAGAIAIVANHSSIRNVVTSIVEAAESFPKSPTEATRQIDESMGPDLENLPVLLDPEIADATNYPYLEIDNPPDVLKNPNRLEVNLNFTDENPNNPWPENALTVYSGQQVPRPIGPLTSKGEAVITTAARFNQYYAKLLEDDEGNVYAISYSGRILYFNSATNTFEEIQSNNQLLSFGSWDNLPLTESTARSTTQAIFRNYIEIQSGTEFINGIGYKVDPHIWFNTQMPIMYNGGFNPSEFITDPNLLDQIYSTNGHYYLLSADSSVYDLSHIVNFCQRYAHILEQIENYSPMQNKPIKAWASSPGNYVYYLILNFIDESKLSITEAIADNLAAVTEFAQAIPQNLAGRIFRGTRESRFGMSGGLSPEDMSANALAVSLMSELYEQEPELAKIKVSDENFHGSVSKRILKMVVERIDIASKKALEAYKDKMNGPIAQGLYRNTPVSFGLNRRNVASRHPLRPRALPKEGIDWRVTKIDAINDLYQRFSK